MGCFFGCFGGRKNRRRQRRSESDQARKSKLSVDSAKPDNLNDTVSTVEEIHKSSVIPFTEICEKAEEKCSPSATKKRVTFDSQVKTCEDNVLQESVELFEDKKTDEVKAEEGSLKSETTDQSSSVNASEAYPLNHRYENCRESDEEEGELDCDESDLDEEYHSDVGFSENELQNPTNYSYNEETDDKGLETEKFHAKPRAVLNPVENLTQWKAAKSKGKSVQKQSQKENSGLLSDQEDKRDSSTLVMEPEIDDTSPSFKPNSRIEPKKLKNQEFTVDASLSTWLSASETTSECNSVSMETHTPEKHKSSCSSKPVKISHDDRPILCALTLEEIKQFSAASTPRKSPSKSPDETPIIGTVGGYWGNHLKADDYGSASSFKGVPNTTSKYREDNKVKWHSTPFEARLEKALNNRDK